jgi:hypothetical protein
MASAKPQTERIMPLATVDATKPARLDAKILEHLSDRVILTDLPLPFSQIPLKMQGFVYFPYYSVGM